MVTVVGNSVNGDRMATAIVADSAAVRRINIMESVGYI
uniref:Uncharacterized protein n=1 Tax=Physcomitrium patens TaxID=3218 RepID=A0A2K1IVL2_PHYPA|nr:hypothetical protein PHYPA_025253 [Physcomitrium patens]